MGQGRDGGEWGGTEGRVDSGRSAADRGRVRTRLRSVRRSACCQTDALPPAEPTGLPTLADRPDAQTRGETRTRARQGRDKDETRARHGRDRGETRDPRLTRGTRLSRESVVTVLDHTD